GDPVTGQQGRIAWTLMPLRHGDRLVGALGAVRPGAQAEEPLPAISDFGEPAAIAIGNAPPAPEIHGRVPTLEAVAAVGRLDITRPDQAQAAICRLIEHALAGANGALWMLQGSEMVRGTGGKDAIRIAGSSPEWWGLALQAARSGSPGRRLRSLLRTYAALE